MNKLLLGMLVLAFFLISNTAHAQNTVGELLDAGGKALTKDDFETIIRDAAVSGPSASGGDGEVEFKANGTASGYVTSQDGRRGGLFGTWTVDDKGKVCWDVAIKYYESTQVKGCFMFYRLGDKLFVGGMAKSARILPRTVKK